MRSGLPAARQRLDIDHFPALDQLRISINPVDSRFVDDVLARIGRQRRVALNVPRWVVAPEPQRAPDLAG
jgi:hypothetical protein